MLDPDRELPNFHHVHLSDHIWPISDCYDSYGAKNYSNRAQKAAQNYGNHRTWNSMGAETKEDDDEDSGVCTPPLWRSSSPPTSPLHRQSNHYRSLSPSSKAQAIARGQRELMEMVSKMPESCYELSLKDLVEQPMVAAARQDSHVVQGRNIFNGNLPITEKKKKKRDIRVQLNRNESIDNGGFLLKMVFPINFGTTKKKNRDSTTSTNKVSPRPSVSDGSVREWWKKERESRGSNSNSGSTKSSGSSRSSSRSNSRSSSRHVGGSCWTFLHI